MLLRQTMRSCVKLLDIYASRFDFGNVLDGWLELGFCAHSGVKCGIFFFVWSRSDILTGMMYWQDKLPHFSFFQNCKAVTSDFKFYVNE